MATDDKPKRSLGRRAPAPVPVDWEQRYRQVIVEAGEIDRRRRIQVDAQKQVINRLLQNRGRTLGEEYDLMIKEWVEAHAMLEAVADYVTGMKYSNVAREVAKIIGDDA